MPRRLSVRRKKKVRGVRRRLQDVIAMPRRYGQTLPEPNRWGYIDFKLPVEQGLVEGSHVRLAHLKQCAQTLLDLCDHLTRHAATVSGAPKVVASICLPDMFSSRVTLFWDNDYYKKFFQRNELSQTWTRLDAEDSLAARWELDAHNLPETCYLEKINNGEHIHENKIWFFGEIP